MEWIKQDGHALAVIFVTLGGLLMAGVAAQWLGRRTAIPRVSLLIGLGIIAGPTGFDLIGDVAKQTFPWISHLTLALVGFLLGGKLHRKLLRRQGRVILSLSLWISFATWFVVSTVIGIITQDWGLAVLLGAIATATDPAATYDVIKEFQTKTQATQAQPSIDSKSSNNLAVEPPSESNQNSDFSDFLTGIVALDDIWGLVIFSLSLIGASFIIDSSAAGALHGLWELAGSIGLGIVVGLPIAWVTGRSSGGEPLLVEALAAVLLCSGLAELIHVSHLLACMTMGLIVTNLARHHTRPFHAISQIEWPLMMLFFVLAGASLEIEGLLHIGLIGTGYVVARILGRLFGGWICGKRQQWPPQQGFDLGLALLPQAGVAIGIALAASQLFPDYADALLTSAIAATVLFELIGPPLARRSLGRQQVFKG